jgi:hypothetical protein
MNKKLLKEIKEIKKMMSLIDKSFLLNESLIADSTKWIEHMLGKMKPHVQSEELDKFILDQSVLQKLRNKLYSDIDELIQGLKITSINDTKFLRNDLKNEIASGIQKMIFSDPVKFKEIGNEVAEKVIKNISGPDPSLLKSWQDLITTDPKNRVLTDRLIAELRAGGIIDPDIIRFGKSLQHSNMSSLIENISKEADALFNNLKSSVKTSEDVQAVNRAAEVIFKDKKLTNLSPVESMGLINKLGKMGYDLNKIIDDLHVNKKVMSKQEVEAFKTKLLPLQNFIAKLKEVPIVGPTLVFIKKSIKNIILGFVILGAAIWYICGKLKDWVGLDICSFFKPSSSNKPEQNKPTSPESGSSSTSVGNYTDDVKSFIQYIKDTYPSTKTDDYLPKKGNDGLYTLGDENNVKWEFKKGTFEQK